MRVFLLLMAFFVISCYRCEPNDVVTQHGTPATYSDIAIQVMREKMPCDHPFGGDIFWYDSPLGAIENACWQPAMGCADPWGCRFTVWISNYYPRTPEVPLLPVWRTALVNEVAYWVWMQCYGIYGESYVNGVEVLDPNMQAWMNDVTAEILLRVQ